MARVSALLLGAAGLLLGQGQVWAQDATWTGATSSDWNAGSNWSTGSIPTGTATFGSSNIHSIDFQLLINPTQTPPNIITPPAVIQNLQFSSNAPLYDFTFSAPYQPYIVLTVEGVGITNSSLNNPTFTTISNGAWAFTNSATAGGATIRNTDYGSTLFENSSSAANASITNSNFAFTQFSGASTAGNALISNTNAGVARDAFTWFVENSSAGTAKIFNSGGGYTIFSGQSSAANSVITNLAGGVTEFVNYSNASNATIINNNGGVLNFEEPGSGQLGPSAANATITNNFGGTTNFYSQTQTGNATIITNSGGRTNFFEHSNAYENGGSNARLITNAGGIVDISGLSYFGSRVGSIEGAGTYFLGSKLLAVGSNNLSTEVSGIISDGGAAGGVAGSLVKEGGGTLKLSGTNTYTGATTINRGVLSVEGSIAASSLTTVNANGALTGIGTVGNTTIASGGIFMPGNGTAGSAMTVNGNLAFQSGALYLVQINPTTASFANVSGTATLGGATVNAIYAKGSYVPKQYTILTAGSGVSGAFNSLVNTNLPSGFTKGLSYDANDAYLNLFLDYSGLSRLSGNQRNVGNALSNFFNSTDGIPIVFGALTPAGLTQASGEIGTGTQQTTFEAMTQFLNVLLDPFIGGRSDTAAPPSRTSQFVDEDDVENAYGSTKRKRTGAERDAYGMVTKAVPRNNVFDPHWSIWAAGFGGSETTNGNALTGSNTSTSRVFGTAVGADYWLSPRTVAGFSLTGGGTNFSVANGGTGRSDLFQAGAFVRHTVDAAYLSGALAYGWQDVTTNRTVTIAGIDQLQARFNANAFSGRTEGGYRITTPWMGITPYAAGQFTTYDLPAYAEQVLSGANTFALSYGAKDVTVSRSELGLRTDKSHALTTAMLTLRSRLAWAHNFDTGPSITPTFQTLPEASFVVNGAAQAHDAALTTASAELKWRNGFSLAATFEGEFSNTTASYAGKGVVRYEW